VSVWTSVYYPQQNSQIVCPWQVFSGYSNTYERSLEPILKAEYRNVDRLTSLTWKKDLPSANTLAYFAVVSEKTSESLDPLTQS
jgi:hypothetical protein